MKTFSHSKDVINQMFSFHRNIILVGFVIQLFLIIISSSIKLTAQGPQEERIKEKIEQAKKMKLLEVLDLDEASADKFLIKYNSFEKKLNELQQTIDDASYKLRNRIKEKADNDELSKNTAELISLIEQLQNTHIEKLKSMKSILNEGQYAKFIVFENEFPKELRRHVMRRFGGGEGPDDDGPPRRKMK